MLSEKKPMTVGYKSVLALSIVMIFVVTIGGAVSGSKASGFGIWYWGYTAWLMHKRRNEALISLQKTMLWFQAIAFLIAFGTLLFVDAEVSRYIKLSSSEFLFIGCLSLAVTYSLLIFFKRQEALNESAVPVQKSIPENIADEYWERASLELSSTRNEATWAKSLAASDGDEPKAKAIYLKTRAYDLMRSDWSEINLPQPVKEHTASKLIPTETSPRGVSLKVFGKLAMVGVICLVIYGVYVALPNPNAPKVSHTPRQDAPPSVPKPVTEFEPEKDMCYVYWDGNMFQLGRTEGDNFNRYIKQFYGIDRLEFALPKQTVDYILSTSQKQNTNSIDGIDGIEKFLNSNWGRIASICKYTLESIRGGSSSAR